MLELVTIRQSFLFRQHPNYLFPLRTIVLLLFNNPRKGMATATEGKSFDVTDGVGSGLINLLCLEKHAKWLGNRSAVVAPTALETMMAKGCGT